MRLALFSIRGYAIILYADEWRMHGGAAMCLEIEGHAIPYNCTF
jgi:hypothetical protein